MKISTKKSSKTKLRIALVAPLWLRVPPKKYGGIEWIVAHLANHLTLRGHTVTLFASGDSKTRARLLSLHTKPLLEQNIRWNNPEYTLLNIARAFEMKKEFDIIHCHNDLWSLYFSRLSPGRVLHTVHNPLLKKYRRDYRHEVYARYRNEHFAFISKRQRELSGLRFPHSRIIYNGIDVKKFKFNPRGGDRFLWSARVDPYKGIENAINAARRLKAPLLLAGRLDPFRQEYFENIIRPQLSKTIRFIGEFPEKQKSVFWGTGKAFLYPILWEEPFGLAVVEAMACGTPVIAFRRGAMEELIIDGKTGFLVNSINEMVEAMKKIDQIDRKACREHVEKHFSVEKMIDGYEKMYAHMMQE